MRKHIIGAALLAVLAVPAAASAHPVTPQHKSAYLRAYHAVRHHFGPKEAGCNLIEHRGSCHVKATDEAVLKSLGVLQRTLAPPPPPAPHYTAVIPHTVYHSHRTTYRTSSTPSTPSYSGGSGGVPACASESGTNYSTGPLNTNASSGATGRYQIIPSTAATYGCNLSTPGGQDACAQKIYAHQGAGAWVGCGG